MSRLIWLECYNKMNLENLQNIQFKEYAHIHLMSERGYQSGNTKKTFQKTKMEIQHTKSHRQMYRYI